jgi:hypothetical protein
MPYFKNNEVNILLIHIPKTGGTSLETYFSNKYNIELNNDSLYLFLTKNNIPIDFNKSISLQHQMQQNGYPDFNIVFNSTNRNKLNYYDYLNKDSIKLINSYYEKDFTYFDYEIL